MKHVLIRLVGVMIALAIGWPTAPVWGRQADTTDGPESTSERTTPAEIAGSTAEDPAVGLEVLRLQVLPMRKAEIEKQAEAWLAVLEGKVREIAEAEIAAVKVEGAERTALLEQAAALRNERTAIVDRVDVVLNALERKGGDTEAYRRYITAVSGIQVELTDTTAVWTTIVGWLRSSEGGVRWGTNIVQALVVLIVFWIIARIVGAVVQRAVERVRGASSLLRAFLVNIVRKTIIIVGCVIAASMLEIDIAPLLAAIGAAGFILAFAMQDSLGNLAAGIMILLYRPFDVGDAVSVAGVSGKVKAMSLNATTITTFDNQLVIVPNGKIWGDVITNVTGSATRRVDLVFGIGYDDDIDAAHRVLEEVTHTHEKVLATPEPTIRLHELADSSVNFIVRPWTKTEDYWSVYWDLTREVKKRFDAEGISIPYPQRDVHVYQEGPEAPRD